jgi:hypothetical protein
MEHELEMAMKRISTLMQTGYLPRHLMADLQTLMNAAMAWESNKADIKASLILPDGKKIESASLETPMGSTRWR